MSKIMPDKRSHRGAHPEDKLLFAPEHWPRLRQATAELSWLLERNYAERSALKLVGDHYQLHLRQRIAVMRCACSDESHAFRHARQLEVDAVRGQTILIDGYNVLTTVEAALAGGVLLMGRDGCLRDMASMHGSFRKVQETPRAAQLLASSINTLGIGSAVWYLDQPVSNSGRLKTLLREVSTEHNANWRIEIVPNPDKVLIETDQIIATADSVVLDRCRQWFNLAREVVQRCVPTAQIVVLSADP